ncbi:MAG TPA: zinc ABC transporter substrate-binding protein [Candidatus Saccharimonadales bacterium]|nr:zinc ABC transporter substrate-binding protein [Candidatus Saccharimonadales bacterium]
MNKVIISVLIVLLLFGGVGYFLGKNQKVGQGTSLIQIVAAEDFYGDIAKQLGGNNVHVTSLLSDPNVDPHEYESNVQDGIAISHAAIVIENGDNYDTWMDKLLSASPNKNRAVLIAADLANNKLPDNPHVWYGLDNIRRVAAKITDTLKQDDPSHTAEYDQNLAKFDISLQPLQQKMDLIKAKYAGTPVGLTETIYLYQAQAMGLHVVTPIAFEMAIAEGNDPSAQDVAIASDQISQKKVKVLIYNEQTITPVTTNMQQQAEQHNIPVVPVTETMPMTKHYQNWMLGQLDSLERALASSSSHS